MRSSCMPFGHHWRCCPDLPGRNRRLIFRASAAPYLAAYRWGAANKNGGAAANEAFARWLNRPVVWAEDFEPTERWDSLEGGDWQLGEWSRWKKAVAGRRLILSVPLLPGSWDRSGPRQGESVGKPVSLAAGARGDYNTRFKKLAVNLVHYRLADSVLRLGWEFNGGWYTWRAGRTRRLSPRIGSRSSARFVPCRAPKDPVLLESGSRLPAVSR